MKIGLSLLFVICSLFVNTASANWKSNITEDKVTGEKVGWAYTNSLNNRSLDSPIMGVSCKQEQDLAIYFDFSTYLNDDRSPYIIRFDKDKPEKKVGFNSNSGTAIHVATVSRASILKSSIESVNLNIRVFDYRDVSYDGEFSLIGFTKALKNACSWHSEYAPLLRIK